MPSTKQRRRAKRHAERLVEEAIEAAGADELPLAEKLIQRALSAGPANARFWLEYARIARQRGLTRRAGLGDGGEFALVDDRPGKRKRVRTIATGPGDAVIFCTRDRLTPIAGLYGRQAVMHGAQEVRCERYAVGIPFHDYQG